MHLTIFLLYGTGGLAWTYDQVTRTQVAGSPAGGFATPGTVDTRLLWRLGWAAGVGVEIPLAGNWTAKAEYLSTGFGRKGVTFPSAAAELFASDLAMQSIQLGLNYRIGEDSAHISDFLAKGPSALETDKFAFHAQATYVNQYDPPFRGSLQAARTVSIPNIGRETADVTLYAGVRLWKGAEAWVNPEIDQGFGLSGSVGAAGFPSGEAYKVGAALSLHASAPGVPAADHRPRRRDPESRRRAQPVFRIANFGSAGIHRRKNQRRSTSSIPTNTPMILAPIS